MIPCSVKRTEQVEVVMPWLLEDNVLLAVCVTTKCADLGTGCSVDAPFIIGLGSERLLGRRILKRNMQIYNHAYWIVG